MVQNANSEASNLTTASTELYFVTSSTRISLAHADLEILYLVTLDLLSNKYIYIESLK